MLTSGQQLALRQALLTSLAPGNKYDEAGLHLQIKQALLALARETPRLAGDIDAMAAASGSEVFRDYAVGSAGDGIGLFALIRVYGEVRGPAAAAELRERMQQLAETNVFRECA